MKTYILTCKIGDKVRKIKFREYADGEACQHAPNILRGYGAELVSLERVKDRDTETGELK